MRFWPSISPTAVLRAQQRCAALKNVTIRCASLSEQIPASGFDLIVLSEIGYYSDPEQWKDTTTKMVRPMGAGATLLATHWLGISSDHRMSGDQVHEILGSIPGLRLEHPSVMTPSGWIVGCDYERPLLARRCPHSRTRRRKNYFRVVYSLWERPVSIFQQRSRAT